MRPPEEAVARLIREAEVLFANYVAQRRKGELWKAGEYLWATFHALLLALARSLGEEVPARHGAVRRFVLRLADIRGDEGLVRAFKDGERLHANFYHPGLLDDEEVLEAILELEEYVDKLVAWLEEASSSR